MEIVKEETLILSSLRVEVAMSWCSKARPKPLDLNQPWRLNKQKTEYFVKSFLGYFPNQVVFSLKIIIKLVHQWERWDHGLSLAAPLNCQNYKIRTLNLKIIYLLPEIRANKWEETTGLLKQHIMEMIIIWFQAINQRHSIHQKFICKVLQDQDLLLRKLDLATLTRQTPLLP